MDDQELLDAIVANNLSAKKAPRFIQPRAQGVGPGDAELGLAASKSGMAVPYYIANVLTNQFAGEQQRQSADKWNAIAALLSQQQSGNPEHEALLKNIGALASQKGFGPVIARIIQGVNPNWITPQDMEAIAGIQQNAVALPQSEARLNTASALAKAVDNGNDSRYAFYNEVIGNKYPYIPIPNKNEAAQQRTDTMARVQMMPKYDIKQSEETTPGSFYRGPEGMGQLPPTTKGKSSSSITGKGMPPTSGVAPQSAAPEAVDPNISQKEMDIGKLMGMTGTLAQKYQLFKQYGIDPNDPKSMARITTSQEPAMLYYIDNKRIPSVSIPLSVLEELSNR